jgi:hypothetical protein
MNSCACFLKALKIGLSRILGLIVGLESELVQHPVKFITGTEDRAAFCDAVAADIIRIIESLIADAPPKVAQVAHADDVMADREKFG